MDRRDVTDAIMNGDYEFGGYKLPTPQKTGTLTQRRAYAQQAAEQFIENVKKTEKEMKQVQKYRNLRDAFEAAVADARFDEPDFVEIQAPNNAIPVSHRYEMAPLSSDPYSVGVVRVTTYDFNGVRAEGKRCVFLIDTETLEITEA